MGTEQNRTKVSWKFRGVVLEKNDESELDRSKNKRQNILNEVNETRKILNTIKDKRLNRIGYVLRYEDEIMPITIKDKWYSKRDRPRKS